MGKEVFGSSLCWLNQNELWCIRIALYHWLQDPKHQFPSAFRKNMATMRDQADRIYKEKGYV